MLARTTRMQAVEASTNLLSGQFFGVHGSSWTISRTTGDGITARPEAEDVGTVTGYVVRKRPDVVAVVAAPDYTPTSDWQFVAALPADVQEGDTLTSVEDGAVYQVMGVELRHGYLAAELEQLSTAASLVYAVDDDGAYAVDDDGNYAYEVA